MLRRWIKECRADGDGQAFRGKGELTPEQEETRRLKLSVLRTSYLIEVLFSNDETSKKVNRSR
ncbi:hypothetical protein NSMM_260114 [Nitrosomonas mobilis]|uniref:Transposase n=1 Tax=Nitrosomonas mobilis TaxID=51642 RepID=A0A1G5SCH7_9PROT|nr:hypothetical protein NSMM_260114 [Nitrosomonas mobilis]